MTQSMVKVQMKFRQPLQQQQAEKMILAIRKHIHECYPADVLVVDIARFNVRDEGQPDFYVETVLVNHHPETAILLEDNINDIIQQNAKEGNKAIQLIQLTTGRVSQTSGTQVRRYSVPS